MSKNDITGDEIKSKANSDKYRNNFDAIFKKKEKSVEKPKQKEAK